MSQDGGDQMQFEQQESDQSTSQINMAIQRGSSQYQPSSGYAGPIRWSVYSSDMQSQASGSHYRSSFKSYISRGPNNAKCALCRSEPVGPDYPSTTFLFQPCDHIFCFYCTREKCQELIVRNQLNKLHCFQNECKSPLPDEHLELLFQEEPVVLEKLKKNREQS